MPAADSACRSRGGGNGAGRVASPARRRWARLLTVRPCRSRSPTSKRLKRRTFLRSGSCPRRETVERAAHAAVAAMIRQFERMDFSAAVIEEHRQLQPQAVHLVVADMAKF